MLFKYLNCNLWGGEVVNIMDIVWDINLSRVECAAPLTPVLPYAHGAKNVKMPVTLPTVLSVPQK